MTTPQEPTPADDHEVESATSEKSEIADMNFMFQGNIDIFGPQQD